MDSKHSNIKALHCINFALSEIELLRNSSPFVTLCHNQVRRLFLFTFLQKMIMWQGTHFCTNSFTGEKMCGNLSQTMY